MSRTRREVRIRVVGQQRKEPDARRLAKAIIRLCLDADEVEGRLADLDAGTAARRKQRRAERTGDAA